MDENQRWDGIEDKRKRYWMRNRDGMSLKRRGEWYLLNKTVKTERLEKNKKKIKMKTSVSRMFKGNDYINLSNT